MKRFLIILSLIILADSFGLANQNKNPLSGRASAKQIRPEITTEVNVPAKIPFSELLNKKFGKLTIIGEANSYVSSKGKVRRRVECLCECGKRKVIDLTSLREERVKSCGCSTYQIISERLQTSIEEIKKTKYGRLQILEEVEPRIRNNGRPRRMVRCLCNCGNEKIIILENVLRGLTKSCGCGEVEARIEHGKSRERLYRIFYSMTQRCYNPKNTNYKHYGGRGIKICNEWLNDFMNFYNWAMANGYKKGLTIDRINNDGNYEPGNCRWATIKEQSRNKSVNKLTLEDVWDIRNAYNIGCFTQVELAKAYGVSNRTIWMIIKNRLWV